MIYSECLVCHKIYDKKEDGKKGISYSHGICCENCKNKIKGRKKAEKDKK